MTEALKGAFDRQQEIVEKQEIASVLVQMREPDSRFYDFLAQRVEEALANPAPSWLTYNSEGRSIAGKTSLEFRAWCTIKGLDLREEIARQVRAMDDIRILAWTKDARATEILTKALQSSNSYAVLPAAEWLALQRVNSAIPAIVAAAQRLPQESAWSIAWPLALYGSVDAERE